MYTLAEAGISSTYQQGFPSFRLWIWTRISLSKTYSVDLFSLYTLWLTGSLTKQECCNYEINSSKACPSRRDNSIIVDIEEDLGWGDPVFILFINTSKCGKGVQCEKYLWVNIVSSKHSTHGKMKSPEKSKWKSHKSLCNEPS